MTVSNSPSPSFLLSSKVLHGAFVALSEGGGTLHRQDVMAKMEEDLDFTAWEAEASGEDGPPRWRKYLNYKTSEAVRIGYMIKDWGTWTLTDAGQQALALLGPHELHQLTYEHYRDWYAERHQDDDDEDSDSSAASPRSSSLTWTKCHIVHAGLHLLSRAPGKQLEASRLLNQLPGLVPEDAADALAAHDPNWPGTYGVNSLYLAVRVNWLQRKSGTWSLTPAGIQALEHYTNPKDLWTAARTIVGRDNSELPPPPYLGNVSPSAHLPQTLYSNQSATVSHLVSEIDHGSLALPDIQRPFVWKNTKVRDLLDSMFRGFPFGFILTWKSPSETRGKAIRTKAIGSGEKGRSTPLALVIDGQQRLTSLFAVMTGKPVLDSHFRARKIQIAFHPIRGAFEVADAAIRRNPEWISDISTIFADSMGALSVLRTYLEQLEIARTIEQDHRDAAEQNIVRLVGLKNTPLGVLEISDRADEEQVADIFVRINSKGQNLKQADFILTLLAVFWEDGREQLENFARACRVPSTSTTANPFNHLLKPGADEMIRVVVTVSHRRAKLSAAYQVLRGKDPASGQITPEARDANLAMLAEAQKEVLDSANWHEFLKCLQAAGFVAPSMLTSMNAALMSYSLFLIGRRTYGLKLA